MKQNTTHQADRDYDFLASLPPEDIGPVYTSIFERVGYFTTPEEGPASKYFDFILYKPDLSEPEIALRCRHDSGTVYAQDIATFWENVTARGYRRAIFATDNRFALDAYNFSRGKALRLFDTATLQAGVRNLPSRHREAILARRWVSPDSMRFITRESAAASIESTNASPIASAMQWLKRELANAPHLAYSLHKSLQTNPCIY